MFNFNYNYINIFGQLMIGEILKLQIKHYEDIGQNENRFHE